MAKLKLIKGIVWDQEVQPAGSVIECNKSQAAWLIQRGVAIEAPIENASFDFEQPKTVKTEDEKPAPRRGRPRKS